MSSGSKKNGSENRLRKAEQQRRKTLISRMLAYIIVPIVAAAIAWIYLCRPAHVGDRPIRFSVPAHTGILGIGQALERNNVIHSAYVFVIRARLDGKGSALKSGQYKFSGDVTLEAVIDRLAAGPNDSAQDRTRVTIPEGFTLEQIGRVLEQRKILTSAEFMKYVSDPAVYTAIPVEFPLPGHTLEGYLFPDTYSFVPHTTPAQVVTEMLLNFGKRFYRPYQHEIDSAPGGLHDIVVKASLIEREARVAADRPRIAGVINNRLQRKMKLQIDATVLYGIPHKSRVVDADLKRASPYNTYIHEGLPPGAIACPGASSLEAALHPEKSEFLYYVARPNGEHIFSATFEEHQRAIRKARAEASSQAAGGGDQ